jgi:hypothetical protein
LLRHAYKAILDHDLTKMTPRMLEEMMGDYNVQGDTRRKAVTFFLQAARYADLPMHPLLSSQIRNSAGRRKKKIAKANGHATEIKAPQLTAGDSRKKAVKLASGTTITLEIVANWLEMSEGERTYVFSLVDKLQMIPPALLAEEDGNN